MKFGKEVCHENTQVEFEFGSSLKNFGKPLGLRKINFQFPFIISIIN